MEPRMRESEGPTDRLSVLYDEALPEVYRYVRSRCGSTSLAEELTSATFMQAALTTTNGPDVDLSIGWLITVARNKLIDHWRRQAVADRSLELIEGERVRPPDPWDEVLDRERAAQVLHEIPAHYRGVLTLRYLDDLSVPDCADALGRTIRSTESLLARARSAFRAVYEKTGGHDE